MNLSPRKADEELLAVREGVDKLRPIQHCGLGGEPTLWGRNVDRLSPKRVRECAR